VTDDPGIDYASLDRQLQALLDSESDVLANSANFTALLFDAMPDINWLGIYVLRGNDLVLGPFQGRPACVRIPVGQGVCGTAAESGETQRVDSVHDFAGHIACDPVSNSELVVPLRIAGDIVGVLDIDSPANARFSAGDQAGVEKLCETYLQAIGSGGARPVAFI